MGHFSLCGRVTGLTGCPGSSGPPVPLHPLRGEREGPRWQTAPEGGGASPRRGADHLCPTQWEKSQLDEEFMHSEENVCGCAKYECGEWGGRARVS